MIIKKKKIDKITQWWLAERNHPVVINLLRSLWGTLLYSFCPVNIALVCCRNWVEELNSFVRTHCICWKLAIKNGSCSLWMGKGLQELRLFSRHWCMPANRHTSWFNWSLNGSGQTKWDVCWRRQHFTSDVIYIEPGVFLIFCGYLDSCWAASTFLVDLANKLFLVIFVH